MKSKRLEMIEEICIRNERKFMEVAEIFLKYNARVYVRSIKGGESFKLYNPILEEETMRLTERYFDIKAYKELRRLKNG